MNVLYINTIVELLDSIKNDKCVGIYGDGIIAGKIIPFLKNYDIEISHCYISERFISNKISYMGVPIRAIERISNPEYTMIIAVSRNNRRAVLSMLEHCNIKNAIIISLNLEWDITVDLYSLNHKMFKNCFIDDDSHIICDSTSEVKICEGVEIQKDVRIVAYNNSKIIIDRDTLLCDKIFVKADKSLINIGAGVTLGGVVNCYSNSNICLGDNTVVQNNSELFSYNGNIMVGNNTTIGQYNMWRCHNAKKIIVGEDCMFSSYINMISGDGHSIKSDSQNSDKNAIELKKHVWVGIGATILTGANIGQGSIVGANAMVNKEVAENSIVAGSPARTLRKITGWSR